MHDEYKSHILNIIAQAVETQSVANPNDDTRLMLRDALINDYSMPIELVETVVSKAHISVDPDIFSDTAFMTTVINGYANIINSNYVHAYRSYVHPREVFLNLTDGLAISFAPELISHSVEVQ